MGVFVDNPEASLNDLSRKFVKEYLHEFSKKVTDRICGRILTKSMKERLGESLEIADRSFLVIFRGKIVKYQKQYQEA